MVTCRTFETPAAGTIPLFLLDRDYVAEIYGEHATELVLDGEHAHEKIADVLERPEHYAEIVMAIREDFAPAAQPRGAPARAARVHRGSEPRNSRDIDDSDQADCHVSTPPRQPSA